MISIKSLHFNYNGNTDIFLVCSKEIKEYGKGHSQQHVTVLTLTFLIKRVAERGGE